MVKKKITKKSVKAKNKKVAKLKTSKPDTTTITHKKKVTKRKNSNKKIKSEPEEDNQIFYMGISNPIEIRRTVLESAKDMVHFLQMFERFRVIREEKKQVYSILSKQVKEIQKLVNKLKTILPKTSLRIKPQQLIKKVKEEPAKIIEEPIEPIKFEKEVEMAEEKHTESKSLSGLQAISADDIAALEDELRQIEEKLEFL